MKNFLRSLYRWTIIWLWLSMWLISVFAAITWPATPSWEVDGWSFMTYFSQLLVDTWATTNWVAKKAQSLWLESWNTTVVSLSWSYVWIWTTTPTQKLEIQGGNLKVNGAIIDGTGTRMDSNWWWIRTYGPTGWYNNTYGWWWNMTDATRIRTYGSKSIYQNAWTLRTDWILSVWVETSPLLYASNTLWKVGIWTNNPTAKLEVNGNIVAADPTANNQVATKAYVDSVIAAWWWSLWVYKWDWTTYLGKFIQLKNDYEYDNYPNQEQIVYVDAAWNIQRITSRERMTAGDWGEYYKTADCSWTAYQIYNSINWTLNYATLRSKADWLYYRHVTWPSCSIWWYWPIYRWDFTTSTCVLLSSSANYCSYNTWNRYLKLCWQWDCKIK